MLGCKGRAVDALWFYEPPSWTGGSGCCWPLVAQFSRPATSASNCQVSRSERHFSTVNLSPHKYWQCIPSCRQMCLGKKETFCWWCSVILQFFQIGSSMAEGNRFCVNKAPPTGCADHGSLLLQLHLRNILQNHTSYNTVSRALWWVQFSFSWTDLSHMPLSNLLIYNQSALLDLLSGFVVNEEHLSLKP